MTRKNVFLDSLRKEEGKPRIVSTAKGGKQYNTARIVGLDASGVLDFFSKAGSMRGRFADAARLFDAALEADRLLAVRALFYLRYFRDKGESGAGERQLFRDLFVHLAKRDDALASKLVKYVPEFGRWDDLWPLIDNWVAHPKTAAHVVELVRHQLNLDTINLYEKRAVSWLPKWLPRENASSATTKARAIWLADQLALSPKRYRQLVVSLSKPLRMVESALSDGRISDIDYDQLPARTHFIHRKLFLAKDAARYSAWLAKAEAGEKKIKTTGITAHDLTRTVSGGYSDRTAEAMWQSKLETWTAKSKWLPVVDNSGSMGSWSFHRMVDTRAMAKIGIKSPQDIASALGAFFSDAIKGDFHQWIMTFETTAKMHHITGTTMAQRVEKLRRVSSDHGTTNISAVYNLLLKVALENDVPQGDMPDALIIISDMEFDPVRNGKWGKTPFQDMSDKYRKAGYDMPVIVFWNVCAGVAGQPVQGDDVGTLLIGGFNENLLKSVVGLSPEILRQYTPVGQMLRVLSSEPYSKIEI